MCLQLVSFYCVCRMAMLHLSQKLQVKVMSSTSLQVLQLSVKRVFEAISIQISINCSILPKMRAGQYNFWS